jgi:hypothetical protein
LSIKAKLTFQKSKTEFFSQKPTQMKTKPHPTMPLKSDKTETEYGVNSQQSMGEIANWVQEWVDLF